MFLRKEIRKWSGSFSPKILKIVFNKLCALANALKPSLPFAVIAVSAQNAQFHLNGKITCS